MTALRTMALLALSLLPSLAAADEFPAVPDFVVNAEGVGRSFVAVLNLPGARSRTFLAVSSRDDNPIVLMLAGVNPRTGRVQPVGFGSASCVRRDLIAMVDPTGRRTTCLTVLVPWSGDFRLIARPLFPMGTLSGNFFDVRPRSGGSPPVLASLGSGIGVNARPITMSAAVTFAPGARQLVTTEIPGSWHEGTLWAESSGSFGRAFIGGIVAMPRLGSDQWFSARMGWIREEDWSSTRAPRDTVVWVSAGRGVPAEATQLARLRVVRNDFGPGETDSRDTDRDGLGPELEAAVRTCNTPCDDPLGTGRCSDIVPCGTSDRLPVQLQDTDRDGLDDSEELRGAPGTDSRDVALPRWGTYPTRRDILVEVDHLDVVRDVGSMPATLGCQSIAPAPNTASSSLWSAHARSPIATNLTRPTRELVVQDFAAARHRLVDRDGRPPHDFTTREPIREWVNFDGTPGVRLHLDLGPLGGAAEPGDFDPLDTRFNDFGGGECVPNGSTEALFARFMRVPRRRFVHYGVSGHDGGGQACASGRCFAFVATERGVFEQEIGHTLGINSHAGPNGFSQLSAFNYKPNYVSAMNYRYTTPTAVGGEFLYSTGDFIGFDLDINTLTECEPLGPRNLDPLVSDPSPDLSLRRLSKRTTYDVLVCGAGGAACRSPTLGSDVDWDGDFFIGMCPGTAPCSPTPDTCSPRSKLGIAYEVLAESAHAQQHSDINVGHAAGGIPPNAPGDVATHGGSATIGAPALAVRDDLLLLAFIDTTFVVNVADGAPPTAVGCSDTGYTPATCGRPDRNLAPVTRGGSPLRARAIALQRIALATRDLTLLVFEPEGDDGGLRWGYLEGMPGAWTLDDRGYVAEGEHALRISLAHDGAPGARRVVMLSVRPPVPGGIDEGEFTYDAAGNGTWGFLRAPRIDGLPWPGGVRDGVGLASWPSDGTTFEFFAAYRRGFASGDDPRRIRFVRRTDFGEWSEPMPGTLGPFNGTEETEGPVTLATRGDAVRRLWAVWTDPETLVVLSGSAIPVSPAGPAGRERRSIAIGSFNRSVMPVSMVWDERSGPGVLPGMRFVAQELSNCNTCGEAFWSDGLPAGTSQADHRAARETRMCADPIGCTFEPGPDGSDRSTQTFLHWLPFFDPSDVRARLRDFEDYPTVSAAICHFVEGAAARCPPFPMPAEP